MDSKELLKTAIRLGENVKHLKPRYIFARLKSRIFKEPRIKLVRGFRGAGKTTLLLQLFNEFRDKAIYLSADSPIIAEEKLYDVLKSLISEGYSLLLVDEIHKYPDWRRDIEAIYDEFPKVGIVCSGSAPLALIPERREELISIAPMGFKEFLELKYKFNIFVKDEWKDEKKSLEIVARNSPAIEAYFREYLRVGGYPISMAYSLNDSLNAIYYSIRKSIYEDAPSILKMSQEKAFAMNKILTFLATSEPGNLSVNTIASITEMSKSTVYELLNALEKMQIIRIIRPRGKGAKLVRGSPKMLFYHPNLRFAVCNALGVEPSIGGLREELAAFSFSERGAKIFTIKGARKEPDYYVGRPYNLVVEIGGPGKTRKQIKGFKKGLVIKPEQLIVLSSF